MLPASSAATTHTGSSGSDSSDFDSTSFNATAHACLDAATVSADAAFHVTQPSGLREIAPALGRLQRVTGTIGGLLDGAGQVQKLSK